VAFKWESQTGRYRGPGGRFVPNAVVNDALDTVIAKQGAKMRDLAASLSDGSMSLPVWQHEMMQEIKLVHLDGAALANGGWQQLGPADYGWVGQRIRNQYRYLTAFSQQIADGRQNLGAGAEARAEMYADAARSTHREAQRRQAVTRGMQEEANRLSAAENCGGCVSATMLGWVPIGTLPPIGTRDCLSRCKCVMVYRTIKVKR